MLAPARHSRAHSGCVAGLTEREWRQVPALEVLDKGDEDVVYRAMHTKLMHGIQKSDKTSKAEKLSSGAAAGGASGATSALARGASAGEAEGVCTKGTSGVAAAAAWGAEAEAEVGVPSSGADVEQGGEQDRGGARRAGSAPGAEGMRGLVREGGQLRKSTTSAMAIRFEALKQTYAQVRSRTSCLNRADGSGRQEMMRRALEVPSYDSMLACVPGRQGACACACAGALVCGACIMSLFKMQTGVERLGDTRA